MSEENKTDKRDGRTLSSYDEENRQRRKRLRRKATLSYVVGIAMAFGGLFLVTLLAIMVYSWIDSKTGESERMLQEAIGSAQMAQGNIYTQEELDQKVAEAVAQAQAENEQTLETALHNQEEEILGEIRVQLAEIGCPIAGDRQYGAESRPLGRLCLHAHELRLEDPRTGEVRTFSAREPAAFRRLCR